MLRRKIKLFSMKWFSLILINRVTVTLKKKSEEVERVNHAKNHAKQSKQRDQQVQRPWAKNVPNNLKKWKNSKEVMQRVRSEIIGNRLCKALWMIVKTVAFILSDFERAKGDFWADELYDLQMSSADLRWLIFLPEILIPACASSSPAFLMMYSAYKLNKQGDNIQPWPTAFPIWNQSVVPCPVLTVASWPAYRFLKRQVRWSGIPISWRIFHSLLWSTQSKALA